MLGGLVDGMDIAAAYGTDDQVLALSARIEAVHSKAEMMGDVGCLRMAQISLATGARALPEEAQEIMVWREGVGGDWTNQDNGTPLIFSLGFDFYHRVAWERGGFQFAMQSRDMTTEERKEHGVMSGGHAQICKIVRRQDVIDYLGLGVPYKEILETAAITGIGVLSGHEIDNMAAPRGRSYLWRCRRRAEKDALRLAFGSGIRPVMMETVSKPLSMSADPVEYNTGGEYDTHDAGRVIDKQLGADWDSLPPDPSDPDREQSEIEKLDANDLFFS